MENEQINLFEHIKKHAKAELNEDGCQIPTKCDLRFHQGHHFEINRGDSLYRFNMINHKNYNLLDCDWLKNSYFPLIHLSSCYRTVSYLKACYWTVCYRTVQ